MSSAPFPNITLPPTKTSKVKRIFFCRHGETGANAIGVLQGSGIDEPLNERGTIQAEYLRNRFKDVKLDLIVSSKLRRAFQTAEIVAEHHPDTPFVQEETLAEISWGSWEGVTSPHLPNLLKSWTQGDYKAMAPEGESPVDVEKRAVPIIYDYILNRSENAILFVGNFFDSVHGRLLRIILSSLIFKNLAHMSDFTHFNTCINLVDVIIESDHSLFLADPLRGRIMTTNAKVNLDDNVTLKDAQLIISESKTRPALEISTILHPESVSFCPLLLDDRSHLPVKMQSN